MAPPDLSAYHLPASTSEDIFTTSILPSEIDPIPISPTPSRPLAILAVGQTGAGKTRLAPAILSAVRDAGRHPAHFIADTYKTYHPEYSRLLIDEPRIASQATGWNARKWLAMAVAEAVRRRLDVVLESACRHPDDFTHLMYILSEGGYRVEVAVLAVPEALSRLGLLTRFYEKLPEGQSRGLPVRLTPQKVHDDSYAGLLAAAHFLDTSGTADQVIVIRRGNLVAYGEDKSADGNMPGDIAVAIETERRRPLTADESALSTEDIEKLSMHEDAKEQLQTVAKLLDDHILAQPSDLSRDGFPQLRPLLFAQKSEPTESGFNVLRLGIT